MTFWISVTLSDIRPTYMSSCLPGKPEGLENLAGDTKMGRAMEDKITDIFRSHTFCSLGAAIRATVPGRHATLPYVAQSIVPETSPATHGLGKVQSLDTRKKILGTLRMGVGSGEGIAARRFRAPSCSIDRVAFCRRHDCPVRVDVEAPR